MGVVERGVISVGGSMVCYKRGVYWSIEQPDSSVMFSHTRLKKLIDKTKAQEVNPSMHFRHTFKTFAWCLQVCSLSWFKYRSITQYLNFTCLGGYLVCCVFAWSRGGAFC